MRRFWFLRIALGFVASFLLMGLAVMLLWNALLPDIFGWHTLSYGQALGILVLSRLLFKGFWGGGGCGHGGRWKGHYWKKRLEARLANMSPEEREKFKAKWQQRCGGWPEEKETGDQ